MSALTFKLEIKHNGVWGENKPFNVIIDICFIISNNNQEKNGASRGIQENRLQNRDIFFL